MTTLPPTSIIASIPEEETKRSEACLEIHTRGSFLHYLILASISFKIPEESEENISSIARGFKCK